MTNQNNENEILGADPAEGESGGFLEALLAMMGPRYTPEEQAVIAEADNLMAELKQRFNNDAQKLSTLLQMCADIATRVAWQEEGMRLQAGESPDDVNEGAWVDARNVIVEKGRASAKRQYGNSVPFMGGYTPTQAHFAEVAGIGDSLNITAEQFGILLDPAINHLHRSISQGLTGYSEAYAAVAFGAREAELAKHHARVHASEPGAFAAVSQRIEWAREWGYKKAREESAECESHAAAAIGDKAREAGAEA